MDVHPTKNVSIGIDPYPYKSKLDLKENDPARQNVSSRVYDVLPLTSWKTL
jgi:hypothetical protein